MAKETETRSDVPEGGAAPDPTAPNVGDAIARVTERRGPGRPRGSKTRAKTGKRGGAAATSSAPEAPVEITEADIQGAGLLGSVSWRLIGKFFGLRELTKDESRELGEAAAPVLAKYLPEMGEYAPEIGLALTLFGLWEATKIEGEKKPAVIQEEIQFDAGETHGEVAGA
jgi:hypothetical protein